MKNEIYGYVDINLPDLTEFDLYIFDEIYKKQYEKVPVKTYTIDIFKDKYYDVKYTRRHKQISDELVIFYEMAHECGYWYDILGDLNDIIKEYTRENRDKKINEILGL